MARSQHEAWTDGPTDMTQCIGCQKATKSHGVFAELDTDEMSFAPSGPDAATHEFAVCHSCYRNHTPESLLAEHTKKYKDGTDSLRVGDLYNALKEYDAREHTRGTTYVGEAEVAKAIEQGFEHSDVLTINDDGQWVIVDTDPEAEQTLPGGKMLYGIVRDPKANSAGGGIMASENPFDDRYFHAYQNRETEQLEFEPIEKLEVHDAQ